MRRRCLIQFLVAFTASLTIGLAPASAQSREPMPESLEIGLSTDEIAITSDFAGADITVFGALDGADALFLALGQYDIVVTLEGPRRETTVRKKERVLGIWINRHSMTFEPVPVSYSLSSTRPIENIAPGMVLGAYNIGIDNLRLVPLGAVGDASDVGEFRQALRRLKLGSGLYQRDSRGVDFVSSTLFRASIRLPASIPVGQHRLKAYLFKTGKFLMDRELPLRVTKTGFEQYINDLAYNRPLLYGLIAVLLAVVTGWLGSVVFRRD